MANYANSYSRLEDALMAMMREKMQSPNMIIMLSPSDEELNRQWDEAGYMVGICSSYGNNPSISFVDDVFCEDDERYMMKDLEGYVDAKAVKIREVYGVEGDESWELSYIDTKEGNNFEVVYLAIEPQYADTVETMLDKFNKECAATGYKTKLSLDRQTMVIEGRFKEKNSNLLNSWKISKQNKQAHQDFRSFLTTLDPYLWMLPH